MIANIEYKLKQYRIDLSQPIDISIPLHKGDDAVSAFHLRPALFEPVKIGSLTGSVAEGGPCNCHDIAFNAHRGTHTECVGHIMAEPLSINRALRSFLFFAELITITPQKQENGDTLIFREQVKHALNDRKPKAVIIRTLPNSDAKLTAKYSGTNPSYLHHEACRLLQSIGVKHLLVDLPSVDKEEDGGKLLAHRAFWQYPDNPRKDCTITELIYVPPPIPDGVYFLNLQIASFESDAGPSKPVLYPCRENR